MSGFDRNVRPLTPEWLDSAVVDLDRWQAVAEAKTPHLALRLREAAHALALVRIELYGTPTSNQAGDVARPSQETSS